METERLISIIAAAVAGAILLYVFSRFGQSNGHFKHPPLIWGIPYIFDEFLPIAKRGFGDVLADHFARLKTSCIQFWLLGDKNYVLRDPKSIGRLLNSEHELVEVQWTYTIKRLLGMNSLSTTEFDHHKELRKALGPAFTPQTTMQMLPGMVLIVEDSMQAWSKQDQIKAQPSIKRFAFQILIKAILQFPDEFVAGGVMDEMVELFQVWGQGFLALPVRIPGLAFDNASKAHEKMLQIVDENLPSLNPAKSDFEGKGLLFEKIFVPPGTPNAPLTKAEQKDVAFNILFAGWETTASSLCFLLRELHASPTILQTLRSEQEQVIAKHGPEITEAALADMPYLAATVKENSRLHPVVSAIPRRTLVDLEADGYYIPKNSVLWLFLQDTSVNDERWKDRAGTKLDNSIFAPDRWLAEDTKQGTFTFGQGPRACLGMHAAQLEMKVWLAVLARKYEVRVLDPEASIDNSGALPQFADGLLAQVRSITPAKVYRDDVYAR